MAQFCDHKSKVCFSHPEGWIVGRLPLRESGDCVFTITKPTTWRGDTREGLFHSGISVTLLANQQQTVSRAVEDYINSARGNLGFNLISKNENGNDARVRYTYTTSESFEYIDAANLELMCSCIFFKSSEQIIEIEVEAYLSEFDEVSNAAEAILKSITFR